MFMYNNYGGNYFCLVNLHNFDYIGSEPVMIEDVLNEILAAEKQAENIRSSADEKAAAIIADAEKSKAALAETALTQAKEKRVSTIEEYTKKAEREYNNVIAESLAFAKKTTGEKTQTVNDLADKIYGRIINGNL